MYLDAHQLFSDAQALTATAVSTNLLDFGSDRNVGIGEPLAVVCNVDVTADNTTADETYEFQVQVGSTTTPILVIAKVGYGGGGDTTEEAATVLVAGYRVVLGIPQNVGAQRYMRLNYVLGGTTPTITVTSHLQPTKMIQAEAYYADGLTIS